MARARPHGVFAIEIDFRTNLARTSPLAHGLKALTDASERPIAVIHRQARTAEECLTLLDLWAARHKPRYPILVVAGHGAPGVVSEGSRRARVAALTLDELADALEGRGRGGWLHVGSCASLDIPSRQRRGVKERIGCAALSGFRAPVDHVDAIAFELILLERVARASLDGRGVPAVRRFTAALSQGYFKRLRAVVV